MIDVVLASLLVLGLGLCARAHTQRLARLRRGLGLQLGEVRSAVDRRREVLARVIPLARERLDDRRAAVDALAHALQSSAEAAATAAANPLDPEAVGRLGSSEAEIRAQLDSIATSESGERDRPLERALAEAETTGGRVALAMRSFDALAEGFNRSRERFPSNAFARLMRYGPPRPLVAG